MAAGEPVGGLDCKLYYDSASSVASPTWVLISKAQDLSGPETAEEVEASARHSRFKKFLAGQIDGPIQFGYLYSTAASGSMDSVLTALKGAFVAGTPLQFAVADGAIATTGTTYFKDWFVVTGMERSEELNGSVSFQFSLKPYPKFNSGSIVDRSYTIVT